MLACFTLRFHCRAAGERMEPIPSTSGHLLRKKAQYTFWPDAVSKWPNSEDVLFFGSGFPHNLQRSIMPFSISPAHIWPVLMLIASNVFMTFAWYGHLKHKGSALFLAIMASWGIAFFEYCLAVPANRIGSEVYSTAQLKTMQEVITLIVFAGFSIFWLKESLTINHVIGFALIALGASFIFRT
jgi:uncharacterized protein (DUF486 family)